MCASGKSAQRKCHQPDLKGKRLGTKCRKAVIRARTRQTDLLGLRRVILQERGAMWTQTHTVRMTGATWSSLATSQDAWEQTPSHVPSPRACFWTSTNKTREKRTLSCSLYPEDSREPPWISCLAEGQTLLFTLVCPDRGHCESQVHLL